MGSLIARAVFCLIFGFFIYETINEFNKLFGRLLNPYLAMVPAVFIFLFQEWVIKRWKAGEKTVLIRVSPGRRTDKAFFRLAWIVMAGFFLFMVLIWAGVVYKQTIREYRDYTTTIR